MPVPFHHFVVPVNFSGKCALHNFRRPGAKAHASAFVADAALLFQQRDDWLSRVPIEFGAVCAFDSTDVSREFDGCHLHAETKTEIRNLVLAREARGVDLSLHTANAEPAGNQDPRHIL